VEVNAVCRCCDCVGGLVDIEEERQRNSDDEGMGVDFLPPCPRRPFLSGELRRWRWPTDVLGGNNWGEDELGDADGEEED
jgi:hypothetical protein